MFQKLLVVHSFRDSGSEARIAAASGAPDLDGLDVRHICIVDQERAPEAVAKVEAAAEVPGGYEVWENQWDHAMRALIKDEFIPALRAEIAVQGTELCLLYSGTIFSRFTGSLLQGIFNLGQDFPEVRWALEKQTDWLIRRHKKAHLLMQASQLWGSTRQAALTPMKAANTEITRVRSTFTTGPEIERLLKAVFG